MSKSTHLTLTINLHRGRDIAPDARTLRREIKAAYGVTLEALLRAQAADARFIAKTRLPGRPRRF